MSVDAATVRRIAHLARVAVADDEIEGLRGELNAILDFVEQLREVNVEGVAPMTSVTPMALKERTDVVTDGGDPKRCSPMHRRGKAIFSWCRKWWSRAQGVALQQRTTGECHVSRVRRTITVPPHYVAGFLARGEMPPGYTGDDLEALGFPPPYPAATASEIPLNEPKAAEAPAPAPATKRTKRKVAAPAAGFACDTPDSE